jgi:hypothetical protein
MYKSQDPGPVSSSQELSLTQPLDQRTLNKLLEFLQKEYSPIGTVRIEPLQYPDWSTKQEKTGECQELIKRLFDRISQYSSEPPTLYYKINRRLDHIEYMVAPDLAAGLTLPSIDSPEDRARKFLEINYRLFGLTRPVFTQQLFLKHTLHSRMGFHCVFGLRVAGNEVENTQFTIHLDHDGKVVLICSVYPPEDANLTRYYQVKMTVQEESGVVDKVVVISSSPDQGFSIAREPHSISAHATSTQMKLGQIYASFCSTTNPEGSAIALKPIVLRDLTKGHDLKGKYVSVEDRITDYWSPSTSDFRYDPEPQTSLFDRVMAYYHTDLIQRHFRQLGLDILDEYAHFNPMYVVLSRERDTYYSPNEGRVYIHTLKPNSEEESGFKYTDAYEPRVLYHEFVHAVTDALARLRRQDKTAKESPYYEQFLQAAAMDEGLADYFACSLAARQGMEKAEFGMFKPNDDDDIEWRPERTLGDLTQAQTYELNFQEIKPYANSGDKIYPTGEQWGRYLWQLRCDLREETADTLIAHSIFFLTRWATFGLGVLAIMTADRLLFNGANQKTISDKGERACDWMTFPQLPLAQLDASEASEQNL